MTEAAAARKRASRAKNPAKAATVAAARQRTSHMQQAVNGLQKVMVGASPQEMGVLLALFPFNGEHGAVLQDFVLLLRKPANRLEHIPGSTAGTGTSCRANLDLSGAFHRR